MKPTQVGQKVQYSRQWLKSTATLTGPLPFAKGIVTKLEPFGDRALVHIDWDTPDVPKTVLDVNLNVVGKPEFE